MAHQLCKKFVKGLLVNIWRNERHKFFFTNCFFYQLFNYYLGNIQWNTYKILPSIFYLEYWLINKCSHFFITLLPNSIFLKSLQSYDLYQGWKCSYFWDLFLFWYVAPHWEKLAKRSSVFSVQALREATPLKLAP